ncbi:MAG: molybdopterin molybdenumtransferase MoeA, partial [Flavobacteriales bacterium]
SVYFASLFTGNKVENVELTAPIQFPKDLTLFHPVVLRKEAGRLLADPVDFNTSGDVLSLAMVDGFIELAANEKEFKAGSLFPVYLCSNE